ncbi:hypothetical protein B0I35DRAFT_414522 [Stachybotrys elegans]|uniref:Uncharacterized protein n=1 Tax=Stachybotrys elegans TaxID=80388 RepID=A0A8K0SHD1_9HYPO|nr:hypothetical protein B0I35DRAFT_414522 [Stachybotrys elegans]
MAPAIVNLGLLRRASAFDPAQPSSAFRTQWTDPSDIFSVLLILGGDVVARALAQLTGSSFTPVAFSFGWVAYAVSAVVASVGENRLMPRPDTPCDVINAKSGYLRANSSWLISRLVRDFDHWQDDRVSACVASLLERKDMFDRQQADKKKPGSGRDLPYPKQAGLCVSVYEAGQARPGMPGYDVAYWLGFTITALQLGIAAVPCALYGDWGIILVTAAGILLSFAMGSLSQWKKEKWACRTGCKKDAILTKGNGSQHVILVLASGKGLDLEDLATGQTNVDVNATLTTRIVVLGLAMMWTMLLITAAGIESHTWYLLAVGAVGIVQNVFVAGKKRRPEAFGAPLIFVEVVGEVKVMDTLVAVEKKYPYAGFSMRDTFFPGGKLRDAEKEVWGALEGDVKYGYYHE